MIKVTFIMACLLGVMWEGGLGAGILPLGFELMPLVGLAVIGVWYLPLHVYASAVLSSGVLVDSMRGQEELILTKFIFMLVVLMIAFQQVFLKQTTLPEIRRLVIGVMALIFSIKLIVLMPVDLKTNVVFILSTFAALLIWWITLRSKLMVWYDAYARRIMHL